MSDSESTVSSQNSKFTKQHEKNRTRSQNRANSIDSQRSIDMELEGDLLKSDDEDVAQKIEQMSNAIDNQNPTHKPTEQLTGRGKKTKSNQ